MLKMLHRYISLCFNAWVDLVVNTRRIRRFVMKWLHFGAAAAFSRWAIFVHEQQRFDRLTATIAGRLGNRALSMGFAGWAAATRRAAHELRSVSLSKRTVPSWPVTRKEGEPQPRPRLLQPNSSGA